MKILVVGSGGREHALAWKLKQSTAVDRVFCAPGNAGTEQVGENVAITANDLSGLVAFAKQNNIGLTVIGPDDPLAAGVADLFEAERLPVFGPTKSAARLESSKIFAKEMMRRCHIPTALAGSFERSHEALKFCERLQFPLVIKADGLALGKGVVIAQTCDEATAAIQSMMDEGKFGQAGRRIVVEEFLRGAECSLHALVSGGNYRMLGSARDHKRAGDGDTGPNTGGMGAVSPADNWSDEAQREFNSSVMTALLSGLDRSNIVFRGLLFPGLMLTADGTRVLEFNCRFGDPETQAILPRLRSDLTELLFATVEGRLAGVPIEWDPRTAVTIVMASGGYPGNYDTGEVISGVDTCSSLDGLHVFHAGTKRDNGNVVTAGGRVLAITALGDNIGQARERAYEAVSRVHFEGCHYRRDIALPIVAANVAVQ